VAIRFLDHIRPMDIGNGIVMFSTAGGWVTTSSRGTVLVQTVCA
jgi:hypothetical protein